jgi:hypothetical protein
MPSRPTSSSRWAAATPFDLNAAIEDGIWGIEEGYLEAEAMCDGWCITSSPEPGEPPASRHSIP